MQLFAGGEHLPFVMGPDAGASPGALLIHGFPGTPAEMRPLGRRLAEAGWTTHGLLLPGFGRELPRLGETKAGDWLDAAGKIWEEVAYRHRPAALVGYSLGAAIALHLAAYCRPDYLVLLAPFWKLGDWRMRAVALLKYLFPTFAPFARVDFHDPRQREFLAQMAPDLDVDDPAVQKALREQVQIRTALIDGIRQLAGDSYRQACRVDAPTLVIQGSRDDVVLAADTRQLLGRLGGPVAYHELPAGHDFPKNESDLTPDFAELVVDFIERRSH